MKRDEIFAILYGKDIKEVYHKFMEIESSIDDTDEIYPYFEDLLKMIKNEKSSIRVRGFRLICKLAKWDKENKIEEHIDSILSVIDDEKPTIVRQCLAALNEMMLYKVNFNNMIENKLKQIDLKQFKDTMSPLIKKDIDYILEHL